MRTYLLAMLLLGSAPALADAPSPPPTVVVHPRRTVIDFTATSITGEVTRPEAAYVVLPKRARFRTLIRTRGNFLPEIQRSAGAL